MVKTTGFYSTQLTVTNSLPPSSLSLSAVSVSSESNLGIDLNMQASGQISCSSSKKPLYALM